MWLVIMVSEKMSSSSVIEEGMREGEEEEEEDTERENRVRGTNRGSFWLRRLLLWVSSYGLSWK